MVTNYSENNTENNFMNSATVKEAEVDGIGILVEMAKEGKSCSASGTESTAVPCKTYRNPIGFYLTFAGSAGIMNQKLRNVLISRKTPGIRQLFT